MKTPISLTIDELLFEKLYGHLFPGDNDEHGAVIVAGIAETPSGTRLLVRDVFLAEDGVDYVPGTHGYRAITARFVAEKIRYCSKEKLCYLAVHCHGGTDSVGFSPVDLDSHERGYPALLDINHNNPVGALVFARNAVAGDIWIDDSRYPLEYLKVIGKRIIKLYPRAIDKVISVNPIYDRHARLFGDIGQDILSNLKVGIIGLGGGGSLLNEWISRLGIGHIVAIDFDKVEPSNLPRVVGATRLDAMVWLNREQNPKWVKSIGWYLSRYKVRISKRVARQANKTIKYDAVVGNILDESVAKLLTDADFIFLATDNIQSRLVFNALLHQYLIPGAQVGVKILVDKESGQVKSIVANTRLVLPYPSGGCLECQELIPPNRLQEESLSKEDLQAQRYVDHELVAEPSVITLNVISAAQAANDLMMLFTGLFDNDIITYHHQNDVQKRKLNRIETRVSPTCPDCSDHSMSIRARGDSKRLPCRMSQ